MALIAAIGASAVLFAAVVFLRPAATTAFPVQPSSPDPKRAAMLELSRFEAPGYERPARETAGSGTDQLFHAAMRRYEDGNYLRAAEELEAINSVNPGYVPGQYYLAACYLLTDRPEQAVRHWLYAAAGGDKSLAEASKLGLAKAYLRLGDAAAARVQLEATIELNGERMAEASGLRKRLDEIH